MIILGKKILSFGQIEVIKSQLRVKNVHIGVKIGRFRVRNGHSGVQYGQVGMENDQFRVKKW